LHGKLTLGTLIIQDIVAIIAITLLSVVRESSPLKMAMIPASIIALCLFGYILSKYVLNYMLRIASKYPELLFIFGLSICFIFVELALRLGISESIGAFIGGVVLANTIYKSEVSSRLKPLLTFFNMLFFVGLGFQLDFSMDHKLLIFTAIFTIITFIIKPAITYLTLRERKYDIKTAFLSGISLSPMSEFGIIVVASGISLGLVDPKLLPIAIISSIASMIIGSYVIKYDKQLWKLSEPYLRRFDKLFKEKEVVTPSHVIDANVVFFGYYEFGKDLYEKMAKMGKKIVVITHDPTEIEELKKDGVSCIYSSVSDPEFFEHHKFENLDLIISNIRDVDENKIILDTIKSEHHKVLAIVTAKNIKESVTLYDYGADYVIYPTYVNEQQISVLLEDYATDINKVIEKKMRDITKFKSMPQPKEEKLLNVDQLFEKMNPRSTTNFLFNMFKAKPPKTE
jgi:Trk K+ transport system NAD-binding subunit